MVKRMINGKAKLVALGELVKEVEIPLARILPDVIVMGHRVFCLDESPRCTHPPEGWHCTRDVGHENPCAAVEGPFIPVYNQAHYSYHVP